MRAQAADDPAPLRPAQRSEPRVAAFSLPPPEQLGIVAESRETTLALDWNHVHRRLRELGTLSSQLQKIPEGGYRFICLLPTSQPDQARRVEAVAATEAEAVRNALARAEQGDRNPTR